jgi:hypothetical protein
MGDKHVALLGHHGCILVPLPAVAVNVLKRRVEALGVVVKVLHESSGQ